MEITKELAKFVQKISYSDIPSEVIEKSKLCIIDCLGCGLGGMDDPVTSLTVQYVKEFGGKDQASVIGTELKADVAHAAFANGIIAHALDYDDYHEETVIHGTAACLPAIMAVAEIRNICGEDLLTALIVGIDVGIRLGLGFTKYHYELGWHSTSTAGRFGATAGLAKLLKLDGDQLINAFGVCGTQAAGVRQVFGSMCKPFNAGKACMDGVMSALLAEKGFTSSKNIIEGELGVMGVLTEVRDEKAVLDLLGSKYYISDISFKPYPTCA
jgi:2-methylcitrate dehydratase PrpD